MTATLCARTKETGAYDTGGVRTSRVRGCARAGEGFGQQEVAAGFGGDLGKEVAELPVPELATNTNLSPAA